MTSPTPPLAQPVVLEAMRVLFEEIGAYGLQCATTGELAPKVSMRAAANALAALVQPPEAPTGWRPLEEAPEGVRVLLGPRDAPVAGFISQPSNCEEEVSCSVVHYNGNVLVAGYHCKEWRHIDDSSGSAPAAVEVSRLAETQFGDVKGYLWRFNGFPEWNWSQEKPRQFITNLEVRAVSFIHDSALATMASTPQVPSEAARLVGGEAVGWTIIGPDGWTFSGEKPMSLILEASRHEREIDPVEADRQDMRLMAAIDEELAEHKRDRAELVNRFLSWPLPASVGSDLCATDPLCGYARTGTNLLTGHEAAAMLAYVLDCDEGDRELAHRATHASATDAVGERK